MGVGISGWRLARAVSMRGQLGVVSGVGLDALLVRRLQDGDPDGHLRHAMAHFPIPAISSAVLDRYFLPEGRAPGARYAALPPPREVLEPARQRLMMLGAFVEVWLAKEGHEHPVGINLLTKMQIPTLPTLYGALLAGVNTVLMGAGIPHEIPGALDLLSEHQPATLRLEVTGLPTGESVLLRFNPRDHWEPVLPLQRPQFLPIVASHSLATMLARRASGRVEGFIVEGPTAGGHNAPPRGTMSLNERGEPVYGERDAVDLAKMRELGLPFWVAGGAGNPARLHEALAAGAAGIQVGTLFAFCDESGMDESLKQSVLASAARGEVEVRTDPRASPTGYPFKIVHWSGDPARGVVRERICDVGYLREAYWTEEGRVGYRCGGEPVESYLRKGGKLEDTVGRQCLCNGLVATAGRPQIRRDGSLEPPLVTSGDDLEHIQTFLAGRAHYGAGDVIDYLLSAAGQFRTSQQE